MKNYKNRPEDFVGHGASGDRRGLPATPGGRSGMDKFFDQDTKALFILKQKQYTVPGENSEPSNMAKNIIYNVLLKNHS